jgi:ubiquinone/menaquinone biosynthesis C-methylase UbiE
MKQIVKEFYNKVPFPGPYSIEQLLKYGHPIENRYLRIIESQINNNQSVLDAGCGTGLITNLMALRHPQSKFMGVDFSNSIDYAGQFKKQHNINNVEFNRQDLTQLDLEQTFDVVICQGVLHHIPNYMTVITKLRELTRPGGIIILGLYHPAGKILKKVFKINYNSHTLYQDQELHPFELSFTFDEIKLMLPDFELKNAYPSILQNFWWPALFNSKNGGLVTYILRKNYV